MAKNQPAKQLKKEQNRSKCSNCGLSNGYVRLTTQEWICRNCGCSTPLQKMKKKGGKK